MTDQEGLERAESEAATEGARADVSTTSDGADDPDAPTSAEYSIAFTPRNLAVGLAIVAALLAFAVRRRRGRRRRLGPRDG